MIKTIRLNDKTHDELLKLGTLKDTVDDVVTRLIKFWKDGHK